MEKVIKLKDVLEDMKQSEGFSISFVGADKRRKTGGEIIELNNVQLSNRDKSETDSLNDTNAKPLSTGKLPSHYKNATRNFVLPNGKIRKAHIWLMVTYNNQKIVL